MSERVPHGRTRLQGSVQGSFLLRWMAAVALAVIVAVSIETVVADRQVKTALLEQYAREHAAQATHLEPVAGDPHWQRTMQRQLEVLSHRPGITRLTVVDAAGTTVAAAGAIDDDDVYDVERLQQVLLTGEPWHGPEPTELSDEDEAESSYEFLVPIRVGADGLVLQVDQRETFLDTLLSGLRKSNALVACLVILLALPLSYVFGGRAIGRTLRARTNEAGTDPLTGLGSRRTFDATLDARLSRSGKVTTLALLDLDEFKGINDRLGHSYGDRVLVALADALHEVLREHADGDAAFRIGGDEFAVVLGCDTSTAVEILDDVRSMFTQSSPGATVSVGVASVDVGTFSRTELLERADAALYEAKRRGRRQTVTFEQLSASVSVSADKIEAVLAGAACPAALSAAFQPIWDLRNRTLIGYEALLRLPEGSALNGPAEAFEVASRLGVAAELDASAREAALSCVGPLVGAESLFLNVHPSALTTLDLDHLTALVARAGLRSTQVVLEVTEQLPWASPQALEKLHTARTLGFRLALDDLGSGNNGLQALRAVPFDVLKIDRSVVAAHTVDPAARSVFAAALTYAGHTGALVIAEGIESLAELDALDSPVEDASVVVRGGQGFFLGRPTTGRPASAVSPFTGQACVPADV